jgi:hypothetical protein
MPTGYTAAIKDGISFKEYAFGCARAFGALIMMRDEPSDAPIPDRFEPSNYHTEALATVSDRLARLKLMSPADAENAAQAEYAEAMRSYNDRRAERQELRAKYEAMLAQVVAWQAPTPGHVDYKAFMEQQIRESIEWDCHEYGGEPVQETGAVWLGLAIADAERSIERHSQEDAKERGRTEGRNAWIKALRDALP